MCALLLRLRRRRFVWHSGCAEEKSVLGDVAFPSFDGIVSWRSLPSPLTKKGISFMQTTSKIFILCLFCVALFLVNGCGKQNAASEEQPWEMPSIPATKPGIEPLMKRGHLFLENSDWRQANEYFDKVLDIDPEYAPAYTGKLCAELGVRSEADLGDFADPISEYRNFELAVRFANATYRKTLEGYDRANHIARDNVPLQLKRLGTYIEEYAVDNRGYPTTEQGLYTLIYIPDNVGVLPMPDPTMGNPKGTTPMTSGAIDPNTGLPIPDPMGGGGVSVSVWTYPLHNPQLYLQQRKRATPYVANEKDLTDPWGRPYRYDNSQAYFGLNVTGTDKPAIWSAGRDGIDGTDDDILNWDPADAQRLIMARQQQMQMQGQIMMPNQDMPNGMLMPGIPPGMPKQ